MPRGCSVSPAKHSVHPAARNRNESLATRTAGPRKPVWRADESRDCPTRSSPCDRACLGKNGPRSEIQFPGGNLYATDPLLREGNTRNGRRGDGAAIWLWRRAMRSRVASLATVSLL